MFERTTLTLPDTAKDDLSYTVFFCAWRFTRIHGGFGDDRRLRRGAEMVV